MWSFSQKLEKQITHNTPCNSWCWLQQQPVATFLGYLCTLSNISHPVDQGWWVPSVCWGLSSVWRNISEYAGTFLLELYGLLWYTWSLADAPSELGGAVDMHPCDSHFSILDEQRPHQGSNPVDFHLFCTAVVWAPAVVVGTVRHFNTPHLILIVPKWVFPSV